jgi:ribose 5-phosphate isomerase RpiB
MICLGGRVMGKMAALHLVETFLAAEFSQAERHLRRQSKVAGVEKKAAGEVRAETAALSA